MSTNFAIQRAGADDALAVATLVGELLAEIVNLVGVQVFDFDRVEASVRLKDYIEREKYFAFIARSGNMDVAGVISLYESYAAYSGGTFGTIPELYVRPEQRARGLGLRLVSEAKAFAAARGWTRLEVTTPPLPQFARTLAFYEREGFAISGGRKLKFAV